MATKDWKKTGKDEWEKNGKKLELIFDEDVWGVFLDDEILIQYTKKSQALAFAKQYMRTH